MRIGFIGIGNMGWPMAANLVAAGHDVTVQDADPDLAGRFAAEVGGRAAAGLGEVAANEVVVCMLPTGAIVREVLTAAEGGAFAAGLKPGCIIIDMSSSEPVGTKELGPVLAERGAVLLDAPVSGGVARAKTGELAIMIGGDDAAAIEAAQPVLQAMGARLFRTGGLGSGHAMKALNNMVAAASYVATAEAMLIGRRFGLDPGTMVEIMNVSTGRNFHTDVVMKDHVVGEKFATGFAVGLLAKDVKIAADLGRAMKMAAPMANLTEERWATARDRLGATADNSLAITVLEADLQS
ncbi:NAD(P)-dependent oxidoreductase [Marinibaculum pumilum]|uniref:NAD(P)-dependent oxidoreductase n=1 Tax=Marinibaculum pumilum TaxID=1766165 RepID=A0ABV7KVI9_9PROT